MNEVFSLIDPEYYADEEPEQLSFFRRLVKFVETVRKGSDPIFDSADLLPFFMINFFQVPMLLVSTLVANRPWKKIDF